MLNMKKMFCLMLCSALVSATVNAAPTSNDLTADNFKDWIQYIQPSEKEESWRQIAWRNRLMPAVEEAKKLDRPILLWAMNGNPCGET